MLFTVDPMTGFYCLIAVLLVVGGLVLYNRREQRRRAANKIENLLSEWELKWLASLFECYVIGDYSGLVHKINEILEAANTDEKVAQELEKCVLKVLRHWADADPTRKAKALEALRVVGKVVDQPKANGGPIASPAKV